MKNNGRPTLEEYVDVSYSIGIDGVTFRVYEGDLPDLNCPPEDDWPAFCFTATSYRVNVFLTERWSKAAVVAWRFRELDVVEIAVERVVDRAYMENLPR